MGKINVARVIGGGLVAGVIINVIEGVMNGVVLAGPWAEQMKSLNRSPAGSGGEIAALNVWGFVVGILAVWLYAAIRPRFGAGPKTAVIAGMVVWMTISVMGSAVNVILGIFRLDLMLIGIGYEFVEMILAALAGAYIYKE